jgi:hypothetical protein
MITALISLLIAALILYVVWYVVGLFLSGVPHQIIGIILGLILLMYGLKVFGFTPIGL